MTVKETPPSKLFNEKTKKASTKNSSAIKDKEPKETKLVLFKSKTNETKLTLTKPTLPKISLFKPNLVPMDDTIKNTSSPVFTKSISKGEHSLENVDSINDLPLPINKKIFNIKRIRNIYNRLHKQYPEVINSNNIKMLSIGINKDISEDLSIPIEHATEFCIWYCGKIYKEKMIEGAERYNLKNEVTGKITIQEAEWARDILDKRKTKESVTPKDKFEP